jgi:hypothetical protein
LDGFSAARTSRLAPMTAIVGMAALATDLTKSLRFIVVSPDEISYQSGILHETTLPVNHLLG